MRPVKLRKTTIVNVTAAQITSLTATLDDGTQYAPVNPAIVGDWVITHPETAEVSILSNADFLDEQVIEPAA